jgi:TrmH family RNA methyltransferase
MRVADWFGITQIVCSKDTVDVYNPKVVQATMGAISRVSVNYCDLSQFINSHAQLPIYGTFLDGDNIYETRLTSNGLIIMGNEGQGIRSQIEQLVTHKLLVPSFPIDRPTSESLNVGTATAVVLAEFRRRLI